MLKRIMVIGVVAMIGVSVGPELFDVQLGKYTKMFAGVVSWVGSVLFLGSLFILIIKNFFKGVESVGGEMSREAAKNEVFKIQQLWKEEGLENKKLFNEGELTTEEYHIEKINIRERLLRDTWDVAEKLGHDDLVGGHDEIIQELKELEELKRQWRNR